jgi:predicted ArsR family transcriptional regulator
MKTTKLDERFFDSTRGRLVLMLRGTTSTVNELAEKLELTDNAVRAQLLSLERDGLIRQSGTQRGHRKPHFAYELTPEAENLFPKAYDVLLNQLITVLKGRLAPDVLEEALRAVGHALAAQYASNQPRGDLESSLKRGIEVLTALGGAARIETKEDRLFISSGSCPLAAAVTEHPEVCRLAETLVSEVTGIAVRERCDREKSPRCSFEIVEAK